MGFGNIVLTFIAVLTLGMGVYLNKVGTKPFTESSEVQAPSVLSEETESSPTPTPTNTPVPSLSPTPTVTPQPTSTPKQTKVDSSLESFIYPLASIESQTNNSLLLSSSDEPSKIISWYKNKLKQLHFNATSIASTNTNGNYQTKMAAATSGNKINIEILKPASANKAIMKINLSN